MNRRRGPRWRCAHAWALGLLLALLGCGASERDDALGVITMPVIVERDGTLYRLAGRFTISEFGTGTVVQRIATDQKSDARVLSVTVRAGDYSVLLEPGWTLTRRDPRGEHPVAAELVSDNPLVMTVRERIDTPATFRLLADGRTLSMDDGTIAIDIEVGEAQCGNGVVEVGEVCDEGALNGQSRCDARCLFRCNDACPLRVDPTAARAGDGSDWDKPLTDLRAALRLAEHEIWVRGGDFASLSGGEPVTLASEVILRGGFAGTERTAADRLPITPRTRLSGIVIEGSSDVVVERVVIDHSPLAFDAEAKMGIAVSEADPVTLRDVAVRDARFEIRQSHVRFEQVDIDPGYNQVVYVRDSNFAWSGGAFGTETLYAGAIMSDSRVMLEELDVRGFVSMDGELSDALVLGCNFYESGRTSGGGTATLTMPRGVIVDSTFVKSIGSGDAPISGGSLFVWNSSFLNLAGWRLRGSEPDASAISGDDVEIVLSSFYRNACDGSCILDVRGVKRLTASLFVQEDPRLSRGQPATSASVYSVDLTEGLAGNCFTYAASAFTSDPSHAHPLLALHHPCPDAADATALERARKRLVELVEPYRVPFFDADVARYGAPDWWRRRSVRAGRCTDDGAPDPGAHHTVPCPK